jgi:hypothetical protein
MQVDRDFNAIFSTLLPNTAARLNPPEGGTFLDGLEVRVAFGGVWKESLTELSGGQRSLLALSLVLALCRCGGQTATALPHQRAPTQTAPSHVHAPISIHTSCQERSSVVAPVASISSCGMRVVLAWDGVVLRLLAWFAVQVQACSHLHPG